MAADREPSGIVIAYWDREEAEANGVPLPGHIDRTQGKGKA